MEYRNAELKCGRESRRLSGLAGRGGRSHHGSCRVLSEGSGRRFRAMPRRRRRRAPSLKAIPFCVSVLVCLYVSMCACVRVRVCVCVRPRARV